MSLASGLFIAFLCLVCLVAYAVPARFRYIWLLLCSYGFYLYSPVDFARNLAPLALLLVATLASFGCTLALHKGKSLWAKRLFFCLGLLVCLGMLLVCKYTNFFLQTLSAASVLLGGTLAVQQVSLVLPLGISYYTLQTVSYMADVYKGKLAPEKNPLRYALYVSFFPGIVTGPINRATAMLPQYKNPAAFSYDRVSGGLFRVLWGLVKKLIIADRVGLFTSAVFGSPANFSGPQVVLAVLLFTYQLYMDFSGSCDVAIGAARMLGFDFMENFATPLAAKSFQDVWRRWHISLTSFFRDYIYIPLGGSRVPKWRWMLNTMLVFLVSAFWHGDGIGYLIWGFLNGMVLLVSKLIEKPKERLVQAIPVYRIPAVRGVFQRIVTYLMFAGCFAFFAFSLYTISVVEFAMPLGSGWEIFASRDLPQIFTGTPWTMETVFTLLAGGLLVGVLEALAVKPGQNISTWIRARKWYCRWPLYYLLIGGLLLLGMFGQSTFIYQQY